jgi:hypothetical protein
MSAACLVTAVLAACSLAMIWWRHQPTGTRAVDSNLTLRTFPCVRSQQSTFAPHMWIHVVDGPSRYGADLACSNVCSFHHDGMCDDGGAGADFSECKLGTDCADCDGDSLPTLNALAAPGRRRRYMIFDARGGGCPIHTDPEEADHMSVAEIRCEASGACHVEHWYMEHYLAMMAAALAAMPVRLLESAGARLRILVVGGGASVLPTFLHARLRLASIDVLEPDGAVVALARDAFGAPHTRPDGPPFRIVQLDALTYMRQVADGVDARRYDVIFLDAFRGTAEQDSPPELASRAFCEQLRAALNRDHGLLSVNSWSTDPSSSVFRRHASGVFTSRVELVVVRRQIRGSSRGRLQTQTAEIYMSEPISPAAFMRGTSRVTKSLGLHNTSIGDLSKRVHYSSPKMYRDGIMHDLRHVVLH